MPTHHQSSTAALAAVLRSAGLSPTPEQLSLLIEYKARLLEWNDTTNLISQGTIETFDRVHILDSLLPLRWLPEEGPLVDLGTGAGLPGIIIKIFRPHLRVTLAESKSRKIKFLQKAVAALNLEGLDVINPTLEKPQAVYRVLVSRAFGTLEKITREAKRYLAPGGCIFAYKGREAAVREELRELAATWHPELFGYSCAVTAAGTEEAERTAVLLRKDTGRNHT